jgi:fructose-bisphosphate aldolase class I
MEDIAKQLVIPSKGILAADESLPTIQKRFDKIGLESTQQNRQAYRQMLFGTAGIESFLGGVILFEETLRDGILPQNGIIPGIKVDQGTESMSTSPNEKVTKGLEGLKERLEEYKNLGAKFAKWRAVITIGEGRPTQANLDQNAATLATYAQTCQEVGLVPIVEPEVLMDGGHSINDCRRVTTMTLKTVFLHLEKAGINYKAMLLKPNMIIAGKESQAKTGPKEISEATVAVFHETVPVDIGGVVFLSGGQTPSEACENLDAINKINGPWQLSFSYGRALQDEALMVWGGKSENVEVAQKMFYNRARLVSLARDGKYSLDMESKSGEQ